MLLPERVLPKETRPIHIIPVLVDVDNESQLRAITDYALRVCQTLRHAGYAVTTNEDTMQSAVGRQLRRAVQWSARFVVLIGITELTSNTLTIKDLDTQQQTSLTLPQFLSSLAHSSSPSLDSEKST
jgi:histidyl-tRNA synthetase